MGQTYSGFGLRFRYPDDWRLSEERTPEQTSITVASPATAFWSVIVFPRRPDPDRVLRAALRAYEEEYEELDVSEVEVELGTMRVPAIEVDFVSMELTNTARLCAVQSSHLSLLVLYQLNDAELPEFESVLEGISDSLKLDSGGQAGS